MKFIRIDLGGSKVMFDMEKIASINYIPGRSIELWIIGGDDSLEWDNDDEGNDADRIWHKLSAALIRPPKT